MRIYGSTVEKVVKVLQEEGPMTRIEICRRIGMDRMLVSAVLSRMSKPTKTIPKRMYIAGWTNDSEGQRNYPRAIYALGDEEDVKYRPKETIKEKRRRWRSEERKRMTMNSVFNLGLTRRQYQAIKRGKIGQHGTNQQ